MRKLFKARADLLGRRWRRRQKGRHGRYASGVPVVLRRNAAVCPTRRISMGRTNAGWRKRYGLWKKRIV
eukprot:709943-Pyramimonas_sp.AAC.1